MRNWTLVSAALFSFALFAAAAPDAAPLVDARSKALEKKIQADLASGAISKIDGDELQRKLSRVKRMEEDAQRSGRITGKTRGDLRESLAKLDEDLARKEKQQKAAMAAASPSATP